MYKDKVNITAKGVSLKQTRKRILWIIIIIILFLAFLLWVFRTGKDNTKINQALNNEPPVFTPSSVKIDYKIPDLPKENSTEFSVLNLAKSYTARFGSWSTDNQGNNLNELLPLSTTKMQNHLKNIELDFKTEEFSGITTKSLNAKIIAITNTSAEVLVSTQKIKTNANLEKEIYYQEIQVKLVQIADKWLVDELTGK